MLKMSNSVYLLNTCDK